MQAFSQFFYRCAPFGAFLQHPDAVFKQRHGAAIAAFAGDAAVLCTDHHVLVQGGVVHAAGCQFLLGKAGAAHGGAGVAVAKGDVAAVIIEGIQGVGGIQIPSNEFMRQLRTLTQESGVVLILDEIQSGYGRTGKFFAHQWSGIKADIVTMAKGICNGYPMGALICSPEFKPVYGMLGTTFGGNHLGCAGAIAVLEIFEKEQLVENARKVGEHLLTELKKIPGIKEVRGRGLMIGMEFDYPVKELRSRLIHEQHVFTGASGTNMIRLLPPLTLTIAQADEFITRLKSAL